ncbi:porin PorA family protein [Nocardia sp. NPDC051911]|uniref:porin PorA family protein n=1 Tax=Nocardia sp. NPDC051911 TaxID=3154648 RepID=UPI0034217D7B
MVFLDRGEIGGRDTLHYRTIGDGPITDEALVSAFPPALPSEAVLAMARSAPGATTTPATVAALPPLVPLNYLAKTETDLQVDEATGLVLRVAQKQQIMAVPAGTDQRIPLTTVELASTEDSVDEAVGQAGTVGTLLWWIGIGGPLIFGVLGVLLIGIAALRHTRGDRHVVPARADIPD